MFVLLLSYIKPIEEVDALMREHVAWLSKQYKAGRFVVSGRQIPRTGGVILARGDDRKEMEDIAASDPFVTGGVATVEVVQFRASQTADGFDADHQTSPSRQSHVSSPDRSSGTATGRT